MTVVTYTQLRVTIFSFQLHGQPATVGPRSFAVALCRYRYAAATFNPHSVVS